MLETVGTLKAMELVNFDRSEDTEAVFLCVV